MLYRNAYNTANEPNKSYENWSTNGVKQNVVKQVSNFITFLKDETEFAALMISGRSFQCPNLRFPGSGEGRRAIKDLLNYLERGLSGHY